MAEVETFDAVIIGTGQGGKPLAGALAEAGWRTAIVERDRVGGTCVVRGCTPTKTMLASARIAHLARRAGEYGVTVGDVGVDLRAVRARKRDIVDSWSEGSRKGLERHDTLELVLGDASFTAPKTVTVALNDGGTRILKAEHCFINVGARTRIPGLPGIDDVDWLDSASIMELESVPEHLVVLGGGFIGLEFGQMFRRFGADVTIIEKKRLASREDEDVSEALTEALEGEGVRVVAGVEPVAVETTEEGISLAVTRDGEPLTVAGSHFMIAIGTTQNTEGLGLESAGVDVGPKGEIIVNDRLETSAEGVWALGDVTGVTPFTHTSYDDYRIIARNLLGEGGGSKADRIVPYAMFTDPQLGRVGMTEREARASGREIRVAKLPMSRVARAIETNETRGFMKAVVDAETEEILGAAILGIEGGEIVTVLQMAMMGGLPWTTLRDAVIAHPTLAESLNNLFMTLD